jgi:hypothetical protein
MITLIVTTILIANLFYTARKEKVAGKKLEASAGKK